MTTPLAWLRAALICLFVAAAGCGGGSTSAPPDMATHAPGNVFGTYQCAQSLADVCASGGRAPGCTSDFATATSGGSSNGMPVGYECGAFAFTKDTAFDFAYYFVYDAASGQLVAVLYAQNVDEPGCVGGPPSLSIPSAACTWVF